MSFGFGSNNNNTSTGFGGFGSGGSNSGFGANNNTTSNTGSLFGAGNNTTAGSTGGFGSGGGFGANNTSSPFGAKPSGFGAPAATTSGGSLFGGGTSTSGGFGSGGFGSGGNTASTGFGGSNTGGGLFGANKPAASTGFGATNAGGSIFGGGNTSSGGFGSTNNATSGGGLFGSSNNATSTGFGASNTNTSGGFGGFGASAAATTNNGTAGTPFNATTEKDGTSNQTSTYQSITMQQPYQGKSFEELRVEDYMQGRRYGNTNGQAGSFGQSTGFGGGAFGNNQAQNTSSAPSLFGSTNQQQTGGSTFGGFGNNNQPASNTTGGFGSSNTTGGGLFGGGQKTLGGFGQTQTSNTSTGGFGNTAGSTGGLFGSTANNTSNTGGGLFGNNNQQQNKPAFGGFGGTNNTTSSFGNNTSTGGGGLFGSSTTNNANTGGGLFGQNQNQQQSGNAFGGNTSTGGGLFGAQAQNKPAGGGLFGGSTTNTNTGGGLFGSSTNQTQQSGGLFGSTPQNNNSGGGLFGGNNQAKPATTSLFGNSTSNTSTGGGGLFGGNQNQQQQSGGLFGASQNNSGGSSLFGGTQNKPAGSGLFGGNSAPNTGGGSLFGGSLGQNNQNSQPNTGNSLFGGSQQSQPQNNNSLFGSNFGQSQNQTPQNNQLHASLTMSPYGNDQLFGSLQQTSTPVGPLATPLNGARAAASRTPSLLSSTRLNSPIYTPRASTMNRNGTYGLSYSTYGTPGSAFSTSLTPAQSSLLKPSGSLGSALSSRISKSMSMSNLRGDGTPQGESLLRPVPGSASSKYLQTGSMRKLTIDRSLRMDLFAPPEEQTSGAERKKSVGFTEPLSSSSTASPNESNALVRTEDSEEPESSPALFRNTPKAKAQSNGTPEMQQVNGSSAFNGSSGLSSVPEDDETRRTVSAPATKQPSEKVPKNTTGVGEYWTKPAMRDLKNMSRRQLEKVGNFIVGREGVGYIEFGNVDLSKTELDDICGKICVFKQRSVTVYPNENDKPAVGQGLNVPSTIHLEHSYPKNLSTRKAVMTGSGPAYDKHLSNLRKTRGTTFKNYDAQSGVWTFTVEHYTTYEMEDDETEDMDTQHETSGLSDPPEDVTMQSLESANGMGEVDDTFEFKIQSKRSQHSNTSASGPYVPGGFDQPDESRFVSKYVPEDMSEDEMGDDTMMSGGLGPVDEDPFTSPGGAVQAPSPGAYERYHSSMALDEDTGAVDIAEETQDEPEPEPELPGSFIEEPKLLRSILKPTPGFSTLASPEKLATDSWEDQLQRTMSPKKRDRQALRGRQQSVLLERDEDVIESPFKRSMLGQSTLNQSYLAQKSAKKVGFGGSTMKASTDGLGKSQAFRTSMDIMNSLWAQEKTSKKAPGAARGFENPYPKRPRLSASADLSEQDAEFHSSMKPTFANNGTLVYSVPGSVQEVTEPLTRALEPLVGEHKEVRFARFAAPADINTATLTAQKSVTEIQDVEGFPQANARNDIVFQGVKESAEGVHESAIWGVASALFDTVTVACEHLMQGMKPEDTIDYEPRLRQDAFGELWAGSLSAVVDEQLALKKTAEEKALLLLTLNKVRQAAEVLVEAKDFKLATMVAQLPGSHDSRDLMQTQIKAWIDRNDWSEMSEPVRALFSIIAGEVCTVAGKNGPAEDRATSFCISEHFGLNWMQSFGLRLFYGGYLNLEDAVKAYCNDLSDGCEKVLPTPSWQDPEVNDDREDTLLGLLRMYIGRPDAEALFDPKTVSGQSTNSRIAWQLATIFAPRDDGAVLPDEKFDQLTLDFAAQLESANSFLSAVWVLLYLHNRMTREQAISSILYRNADKIPDFDPLEDVEGVFHRLHHDLQIPTEHIWRAKAQHASDTYSQVVYLLNANDVDAAHDVLCSIIGPQAVIEQEHEELTAVLARFPERKPRNWVSGGGVFEEYAKLWNLSTPRKHTREGREVMERLGVGLREMSAREGKMSLEERVAVVEMERVLREEVRALHGSGEGLVVEGFGAGEVEVGKGMDAFVRYREALGVVA